MRIRGARLRGGRAAEAGPTFTDWAPACEAIDPPEEDDGLIRDGEWDDEADRDGDGGRNSSAIPGATLTGNGAAAAAAAAAGFSSDVLRDGGSDPANAAAPTIGPAAAAPDDGIIPNSTPTEPTGAGAAVAGCAGPTPPPAAAAPGKDSARRNAMPSSNVATAKASAPQ